MSTIKVRTKVEQQGLLVRILIDHPMETGRRGDPLTGLRVTADFIKDFIVLFRGKVVVEGRFSTGVSKNPYLNLILHEARPGEVLEVRIKDNEGREEAISYRIPPHKTD